jgi:hypothetical protein
VGGAQVITLGRGVQAGHGRVQLLPCDDSNLTTKEGTSVSMALCHKMSAVLVCASQWVHPTEIHLHPPLLVLPPHRDQVEQLVDGFPGQSIDFFGALRARVYDDKVGGDT